MPKRTDSRDRMVQTAADLFRRQGYHATAFSEVVAESGAPRGSIYFHFPGGKEELAVAVAQRATDEVAMMMQAALAEAGDAPGFVRALAGFVSHRLESSDYRNGCAVATMVLELAPHVEPVRAEFEKGFSQWRLALAEQFERFGYPPARAAALGTLLISTLEGALILARAARSVEPIETSAEAFLSMLEPPGAAVSPGPGGRAAVRPRRGAVRPAG